MTDHTTSDTRMPMTCGEFEPLVQDYLENDVGLQTRERMDAHRLGCAACDALVTGLIDITARAAKLDDLQPARDLWAGIESRIEAEVVPIPTPVNGVPAAAPVAETAATPVRRQLPAAWKALLAASLLVAATATITWRMATRMATPADTQVATAPDTGFALAMDGTRNVRLGTGPTLDQTYDQEIAGLRKIVDERLPELDSVTVVTLQKNLKIIDDAIAACKAALSESPSSAFLLDQLTDAYDSKLRVLRAVAGVPQRG